MDTKKIFLSIIIPIYNADRFLETCMNSMVDQNIAKTDYEIICINDGSTDNSLTILQNYADKYSNIRVINKPNGGVSAARNLGLSMARGEYLWFVDADDWIAHNCLKLIQQQVDQSHPSIIQVHYDWIKADWRIAECKDQNLEVNNVHTSIHNNLFLNFDGAWSTIIRNELLKKYGYTFREDLDYGEDILFVRDIFDTMQIEIEHDIAEHKIVHMQNETIYYYRLHNCSACRTSWTKHRVKYLNALLKLAIIDRERMLDSGKPNWYKEKYAELYCQRMYNYLMHWLPGVNVDLREHFRSLKNDKLLPIAISNPTNIYKYVYKNSPQTNNCKERIIKFYRYFMFRTSWLYPIYYKQMKKKYDSNNT